MQFESEDLQQKYRKIRNMSETQKKNLKRRVESYNREYAIWEVGEGHGYPIGSPPEGKPTDEEFEIYEQISIQPQIRVAQSYPVSTAHLKYDADQGIKGAVQKPMTSNARANIFNFAGPEYTKLGEIMQQRKPKFGAESETKEQIFDKRFPWGGKSKKRRKNKRKSKKIIHK